MVDWQRLLFTEFRFLLAVLVLIGGFAVGYLVGKLNRRLLEAAGVPGAVEGTTFERTAQGIGTSTVKLFARLSSWFIYAVAIVIALYVARLLPTEVFVVRTTAFIPDLFIALVVLALGFLISDKAELTVSEALRGVKVPEIGIVPRAVKYSVLYIAFLIALGQIGVAVAALLVMLGAYLFAVILFSLIAFRDLLTASAAGVYLLLNQPYGIGDTVAIGDRKGIVQEVGIFVTHIESDDREYIVPNHLVMREGAVRVREY